jgi:homoserine kinase
MSIVRPWVEAYAPATVSNLGPGFDCLGLAIHGPGDTVRARRRDQPGVVMNRITGDGGRLPRESDRNTACVAVQALLDRLELRSLGVELELDKGLPLGSGLGSSGASACAALVASVAALDLHVGAETLIDAARVAEGVACGSPHPDNVAPAILGGIVLVASLAPLRVISLPVPERMLLVVYTPGCEVPTAQARAVLPKQVGMDAVVRQAARLGLLVHALHQNDLAMLGEAITDDLIEPARAGLIPGFLDAKAAALEAGALACTISGAGPTTLAITNEESRARALLDIIDEAFTHAGVPGRGFVERVGPGARVTSPVLH